MSPPKSHPWQKSIARSVKAARAGKTRHRGEVPTLEDDPESQPSAEDLLHVEAGEWQSGKEVGDE